MELKANMSEVGKSTDMLYVADCLQDDETIISSPNMCTLTSEQASIKDSTTQPKGGIIGSPKSNPIVSRVFLILLMILVVVILQIPTILYYTELPDDSVSLLDSVDFETCRVS